MSLAFNDRDEAATPIGRYSLDWSYEDDDSDDGDVYWEWSFVGPDDARDSDYVFPTRAEAIADAQDDFEFRMRQRSAEARDERENGGESPPR